MKKQPTLQELDIINFYKTQKVNRITTIASHFKISIGKANRIINDYLDKKYEL